MESSSGHLERIEADKRDVILAKKSQVQERFQKMLEPLIVRRTALEKAKLKHQFVRDVEDELMWIAEKRQQATSRDFGNSLLGVQMLLKKNKSLRTEVDGHQPRIDAVCDVGQILVEEGEDAPAFQARMDDLLEKWQQLQDDVELRRQNLELSEVAQQVRA